MSWKSTWSMNTKISIEFTEDVGVGCILGGVANHIKVFMPHLLKDERGLLAEGP